MAISGYATWTEPSLAKNMFFVDPQCVFKANILQLYTMIIFKNHLLWTNPDLTKSKHVQATSEPRWPRFLAVVQDFQAPSTSSIAPRTARMRRRTQGNCLLMDVHLNNRKNGCNRCCSPTIHATLAPQMMLWIFSPNSTDYKHISWLLVTVGWPVIGSQRFTLKHIATVNQEIPLPQIQLWLNKSTLCLVQVEITFSLLVPMLFDAESTNQIVSTMISRLL